MGMGNRAGVPAPREAGLGNLVKGADESVAKKRLSQVRVECPS
jgi:hypothetical protein